MTTIAEVYATEMRDRTKESVEDLILDSAKAENLVGLNDNLDNLKYLSVVGVGLTSLEGLPSVPLLANLNLTGNKISGGLDILIKNAPVLETLNLSSNSIESLDALRTLKMLTHLEDLELSDNKITEIENYRQSLFDMLPNLKVLDGKTVDGEEIDATLDDEEEEAGDEAEEESDEEDGPGLSYLDKSQFSDDETEDYNPDEPKSGKRKADADGEAEPAAKKVADAE